MASGLETVRERFGGLVLGGEARREFRLLEGFSEFEEGVRETKICALP